MSLNTSYGNFEFFSKIDNYASILSSISSEEKNILGNLSGISVSNDKLFLLSKSPPKISTYLFRGRQPSFRPLTFTDIQNQAKIISLLHGSMLKNCEYYVAVGIVEDSSSSFDSVQKICILIWGTSNLECIKKIIVPMVDASRVKSIVDVKIEKDSPHRMIIAFNSTDASKGNIYVIHDPFNISKSKGLRARNIEEICIHNGSSICGFGFVQYASRQNLFVASEKAIWKLDLDKKSPIKICNLRSGQNALVGEGVDIGCPVQCADISTGEYPVFSWDECNGSDEEGRWDLDTDPEQFLVTALSDKLMIIDCNRSTPQQGHAIVELDYHATQINKTKLRCMWFNQYLILHSRDSYQKHTLSIYSLCGKIFRAFECTFHSNQSIEDITTLSDRCLLLIKTVPSQSILPAEYSIFAIEEMNIKKKLEILTKSFKYDHALVLALTQLSGSTVTGSSTSDMLEEEISDILKKSGDNMIANGEYDKAILRYLGEDLPGKKLSPAIVERIRVESSAVIKSFSEAQAIEPLTKYLVKLHEINQADNEHTKLLLECYIQDLKYAETEEKKKLLNDQLNYFLNQSRSLAKQRPIQIIAIKTLRRAGYRNRALSQAYKEPQQDELIIQIETDDYPLQDGHWNFKRALAHLESMKDFNLAVAMMEKYGSVFMQRIPQETTNVMIRLCTPGYAAKKIEDKKRQFPVNGIVESFDQNQKMTKTFKGGFSLFGALEMLAQNDENFGKMNGVKNDILDINTVVVNPEKFIKAFAGNDYWLMVFLESVVYSYKPKYRHKFPPVIFNTLLEIYLMYNNEDSRLVSLPSSYKVPYAQISPQKDGILLQTNKTNDFSTNSNSYGKNLSDIPDHEKSLTHQQEKIMRVLPDYDYSICLPSRDLEGLQLEDRIMKLLEMENPDSRTSLYGLDHALVLVQAAGFEKGILYLYSKLNLHYDILQYYESKKNYSMVMETLQKHGQKDPNMWMKVLSYLSQELETAEDKKMIEQHIMQILYYVKNSNILPPLIVIQILSRNKYIKIEMIKDYLKLKLETHQNMRLECGNKILALQNEIKKISQEIMELKERPRIFQKQRCSSDTCNKPLDLPTIHFMCLHSYHQRCLTNEEECPRCANELRTAIHRYQDFVKPGENYEAFDKMFKSDGLSAVTHYFGLGIFKDFVPQSSTQSTSNYLSPMNSLTQSTSPRVLAPIKILITKNVDVYFQNAEDSENLYLYNQGRIMQELPKDGAPLQFILDIDLGNDKSSRISVSKRFNTFIRNNQDCLPSMRRVEFVGDPNCISTNLVKIILENFPNAELPSRMRNE